MIYELDKNHLDDLRIQVRDITFDIIRQIHKRMDMSKQIGNIKKTLDIDIEDEKVEQELKNQVSILSNELGLDNEFTGKIINLILQESVKIQKNFVNSTDNNIQTHMAIFMKAKELEKKGKKIIHMEVGEPDYPPPKNIKKVLSTVYDKKYYHYTEISGIPKLRESIATKLDKKLTPENIIITPGGRFGVFAAIISLLKFGDELIYIEPSWPAYKECADLLGIKTRVLNTNINEDWTPNISNLEKLINVNTKMIVLNYPNNPTGKILDKTVLDKIISMARKNNLYVLSDEVYSDYSFKKFTSLLDYEYENGIIISSFSKRYAMTGFRVGYCISTTSIISKIKKIQATAITSVAEPMQYCALSALENETNSNCDLIKDRLDFIVERLNKIGLKFIKPDGAMYVYPKLNSTRFSNDMELVNIMLDHGVAISPGSGFGKSYNEFIRLSACQPTELLKKGMDILEKFII
ncbi:MAG: aspartate aminotransferase [Nitrososphaeraceae archaeon]|nr:aspartate aminotransferase [Nitrososphaeraceae archaeon]